MYTLKPVLIILCGAPLHGKSATAAAMKAMSNVVHLDVDEIRWQLFPGSESLGIPQMPEAYRWMINQADNLLRGGRSVVCTGTFSKAEFKDPLIDLMERTSFHVELFRLDVTGIEEIRRRIEMRRRKDPAAVIDTEEKYRWALTLPTSWPASYNVRSVMSDQPPEALADYILKIVASA